MAHFPTLHTYNTLLGFFTIILCAYVIAAPLWPQVSYTLQEDPPLIQNPENIPTDNTLVIPGIKLQQTIHEGGEEQLNKGIWHTPNTANPEQGSNMVVSGHRFTYGGPAVLYHMDKIKLNDEIYIYWNEQKYIYRVEKKFTVSPDHTEILQPTDKRILTIYTCTPLVTATNRLVIQATLIEDSQT